jgi:hypothetical protein
MTRALWTMFVAVTWLRSKLAARTARKLTAQWDVAVKALGFRPPEKAPIPQQVAYALADAKVAEIEQRTAKAGRKATKRFKTYVRVRDFGPRWLWSYIPYAEISALGVAVGWLAHNRPETLTYLIGQGVRIAGNCWQLAAAMTEPMSDHVINGYTVHGVSPPLATALVVSLLTAGLGWKFGGRGERKPFIV